MMILIEKNSIMPLLYISKITDEELDVMKNIFSSISGGLNIHKSNNYGVGLYILDEEGSTLKWETMETCLDIMLSMGYQDIHLFKLVDDNNGVEIIGKFSDIKDRL